MNKLKSIALSFLAVGSFLAVNAQTADEVIAKHLQAIGGKEKLLALKSSVSEATMSAQGADIAIKIYQTHNKAQRTNINVMNMDNYIIQTVTEGWSYMPIQGQTKPEAMPAEVVKENVDFLDLQSPLLNYKEKGHQVELVGKEDVEGVECYKLKAKMKRGADYTVFIDPANYYVIKAIIKSKASGKEVEQTQTFSNYKKLDNGYVFPFAMTGFGPGEVKISKIEVNVPIDEKMFQLTPASSSPTKTK
jgi:hypothetical protein